MLNLLYTEIGYFNRNGKVYVDLAAFVLYFCNFCSQWPHPQFIITFRYCIKAKHQSKEVQIDLYLGFRFGYKVENKSSNVEEIHDLLEYIFINSFFSLWNSKYFHQICNRNPDGILCSLLFVCLFLDNLNTEILNKAFTIEFGSQ